MRCKNCTHYDVCYQYDIIGEDDNEMCALYEQKRPQGEWIEKYCELFRYYCSICGRGADIKGRFCPNCGASMRKEGEQKCGE